MTSLDYSSDEVMKILNNPDYDESQKKDLFEKYKSNLKQLRRKEIVNKVSEVAKKIPTFTEEDYVGFMKNYENDNLSKPFEVINNEIKQLEIKKTEEYNAYLESQKEPEPEPIIEEPIIEEPAIEEPLEEIVPDVRSRVQRLYEEPETNNIIEEPSIDNSVLNEEPEILAQPLFEDDSDVKDVMPDKIQEPLGEKGNASAIIVSIIAIIIGAVAMYTLIKLN